ncbi:MAG: putative rhamnosyl transferase [Bacteroidales bacterium]|jgi:hypothetical protein|nr:putative rhamnosyl transferase [Bacteroidales bacterium]
MKKQFKHYVITRFNIELEGLSHYKNPDWVAERYELFAKNLYLSLLNQTNFEFELLFAMHPLSKPAEVDKIAKLFIKIPNFNIVFMKNQSYFNKYLIQEEPYIITTRIDTDDIVHKDFINEIQKNFIAKNKTVLNFSDMLIYNWNTNRQVIKRAESNQFTSLIEDVSGDIETIYGTNHTKLQKKYKNYVSVKTEIPMICLQLHDTNISYELRNKPKTDGHQYQDYKFNISDYKKL